MDLTKVGTKIFQLKGLKPKNKGHTNFYECWDLTKKVYLECHAWDRFGQFILINSNFNLILGWWWFIFIKISYYFLEVINSYSLQWNFYKNGSFLVFLLQWKKVLKKSAVPTFTVKISVTNVSFSIEMEK